MYVSLHNRSAYSFCSALTTVQQLVAFAAAHRMPAVALTDLDGMYGAIEFLKLCNGAGVKPIIGVELTLADGLSVTLLARDMGGYGNLCRLASLRHLGEQPLRIENVLAHAAGVICLIGSSVSSGDPAESSSPRCMVSLYHHAAASCRDAFEDRLYMELSIHSARGAARARRLAAIADELHIPVVATCQSRCIRFEDNETLRAYASIGTLTLLDQPHPDKPQGLYHLQTPAEMHRLFRRRPDALANTLTIAEQCSFTIDLTKSRFPSFASPDGKSAMDHLRKLGIAGCRRRYIEEPQQRGIGGKRPTLREALKRLQRELAVIEQVHYAEYFLVFHEIVQYCNSQGIASLARGSAADSLICYALGVSHACPFRFNLPFDRFINPERARFSKMADIDLDLPWDRRDQIIRWVYDRWGHDRVAMIGSANTFHARAAVAQLGKVFGLPAHELHRTTKMLPRVKTWNIRKAVADSPEAVGLPIDEQPYRTILQTACALEGLPHHWAMHPCGLVVSPDPLTDLVPVQPSPKGLLVAQYDMNAIEDLGFVKIDLLGQAGLSVLRDTVAEVRRTDGKCYDLDRDVDYSHTATWHMIASGDARGVHHIESPAITSLIRQCNVHDIDCLTAIVAIIRPGAANQGKKNVFARRYQGFEKPAFAHPSLMPVLEETYGLMVFEEHILQTAVDFAGMNIGRADVLRRALNKEDHALIRELESEFHTGARCLKRSEQEIAAVWKTLEEFSGFMFNKAHSAEYAIEAFQGAWLKRRHPAHYLAAVLSNYRGFYAHSPTLPQILYVLEAARLGIGFLPPCVNSSQERFSVEYVDENEQPGIGICSQSSSPYHDPAKRRTMIRIPVSHIKGVTNAFLERYFARRAQGRFTLLEDFADRCRPGESEARVLLDSGALDCFGESRPEMFWKLRGLLRVVKSDAASLWSTHAPQPEQAPPIELTNPGAGWIARREMELLGFPVTLDPLTLLGDHTYTRNDDPGGKLPANKKSTIEHRGGCSSAPADPGSKTNGSVIDWSRYVPLDQLDRHCRRRVTICGLIVADRVNRTTGGKLMKFVTLADRTAFVEAVLFPDTYRRMGHLTAAHPILAATGVVEPFENHNGFTLTVHEVFPPFRKTVGPIVGSDGSCGAG